MDKMIESTKELMEEQMPSFDFLLDEEAERNSLLAEHRAWLKSIKHERPLPKHPFHVAVYIRYFNQTRYENYLSAHKKQFLDTLALCPKWDFVGFYVDEGSTAPNMETAPEWSRLLQDCYDGKVDLVITQKASNISKKLSELAFCTRLLAALPHPVGIYFISEDIYIFTRWLPIIKKICMILFSFHPPTGRYYLKASRKSFTLRRKPKIYDRLDQKAS